MKTRQDFVTNSSSSSFVIAKTKDCRFQEVRDLVASLKKNIIQCMNEYHEDASDEKIEAFIDSIAQDIFYIPDDGMMLGDWIACAIEYGDDDDIDGYFLYNYGHKLKSEHFKMG